VTTVSVLTSVAGLAVAIALVLLVGRLARAVGLTRPVTGVLSKTQHITLIDTIALDTRRRLSLVACSGRQIVVLSGGETDVVVVLWPVPADSKDAPP
jgi:flagellar protein FliO/FliZ